jgi:excisionase family DNA binding protein
MAHSGTVIPFLSTCNSTPPNKEDEVAGQERQTHHEIVGTVQRRTLTVEEAGRMLGIGRSAAYAAANRGEIPTISIGRRLLVPRDALERMLAGEGTDAVA